MLTRIEISGFKTFDEFALNLAPFTVIVGENASGKSNLFDAIQMLSRLATTDLSNGLRGVRGEADEAFRKCLDGTVASKMSLKVEMLLDPSVTDPWGQEVKVSHTRVRYEVEIERRTDGKGAERLVVAREVASPIRKLDDEWPKKANANSSFRRHFMKYGRIEPWLSTDTEGTKPTFNIHQDGRRGRKRSALAAEATILSSITNAEFPHLFAIREEMRHWRFLQIDPGSLRRPSPLLAPDTLEPDGSNLAKVLARIRSDTAFENRPKGCLSDITADLAQLVRGIVDLDVTQDKQNREYRLNITMRGEQPYSSRVTSDGTLRLIALLTMLHDPKHHGLVCFEEPENGIHPSRLKLLLKKLRSVVTDVRTQPDDPQQRHSQILMNSHSPVVLAGLREDEMVFADLVDVVDTGTRRVERRTRVRSVVPKDQGELALRDKREFVTRADVNEFLSYGQPEGVE
jgi:predicted ATPase